MSEETYKARAKRVVDGMIETALASSGLADTPTARFALLDSIEADAGKLPDEILAAAVVAELKARRPGIRAQAEKNESDKIRQVMLNAIHKDRSANIRTCLKAITACDTMLSGLPKLKPLFDPDRENMRLELGRFIKERRKEEPDLPESYIAFFREMVESVHETQRPHLKAMTAIIKSQETLARYLRHVSTMTLIYAASDQGAASDAAHLAANLGAGDQALREFARTRFPDVFDKQAGDSGKAVGGEVS